MEALIALNGLKWPVVTDGTSIQIGCEHHTVTEWAEFGMNDIEEMDSEAQEFWSRYREPVLALATLRRSMD